MGMENLLLSMDGDFKILLFKAQRNLVGMAKMSVEFSNGDKMSRHFFLTGDDFDRFFQRVGVLPG